MAMLWHPRVFVMIVELGQQQLAQVSVDEVLAIQNEFGSQVQAVISSSVTSAPQYSSALSSHFLETSSGSFWPNGRIYRNSFRILNRKLTVDSRIFTGLKQTHMHCW